MRRLRGGAPGAWTSTYHDGLQPLADPPLALLPLLDLPPQRPRLVPVPPHVALGLLPPQHGALEGGVGRLALQHLGLRRQRVELRDLVVDRADALAEVGPHRRDEDGAAVAVAISLLVDALGGRLEEGPAGRAGEARRGIHFSGVPGFEMLCLVIFG